MHPVERERQQAFQFAAAHRIEDALRTIGGLLKQYPGHALLLLDLADLTLQLPDREKALRLIRQALETAEPRLLARASGLLLRARLPEESLAVLRKEAESENSSEEARLDFARALERLNRLDEAKTALARVGVDSPAARLLAARLCRRAGDGSQAVDIVRGLLAVPGNEGSRAMAGYELAHSLDRLGDFSGAYQALKLAKRSMEDSLSTADREQWAARLQREGADRESLLAAATSERLSRWADEGPGPVALPVPVILTGHPRSGTTLLERLVMERVAGSPVSEEQIFRMAVERGTSKIRRTGEEGTLEVLERVDGSLRAKVRLLYRGFLGERAGVSAILDKEPSYQDYLPVMLRFLPEMRVIVMRRDPRDVLLSSLFVPVPVDNVSAWAWLEPERAAGRIRQVREGWERLGQNWPGAVAEVDYEDLVKSPEAVVENVVDFGGFKERSASVSPEWISSPSYPRAGQAVDSSSVGRWKNYEPFLGKAFEQAGAG